MAEKQRELNFNKLERTETTVQITLVIKGAKNKAEAENRLLSILNDWFLEDKGGPPYPDRSLLFYSIVEKK